MVDKRIRELPLGVPNANNFLAMDLSTTERATIRDVVLTGRPSASQPEAVAGLDSEKAMTPLTTKQSIASEVGVTLANATQGQLADTAIQAADIGNYFTPVFDTRNSASTSDLTAFASVTVNRWDVDSIISPAIYEKVESEPSFDAKFQDSQGNWFALTGEFVTPEQFGCLGNGTDETVALQRLINFAFIKSIPVMWSAREFRYTTLLLSGPGSVIWKGAGRGETSLRSIKASPDTSNSDADYAVRLGGNFGGSSPLVSSASIGQSYVSVSSIAGWSVGDICDVRSTRLIQCDSRGQAREGQISIVERIDVGSNRLYLKDSLNFKAVANDTFTGAIQAVGSTTSMTLPASVNRQPRDMMARLTMTSGPASGQFRYITAWDNATKVATFGGAQSAWPAGISAGNTFIFEWVAEAVRYVPPKIDIRSLSITREKTTNAVAGDLGFRGLDLAYCYRPIVEGCEVTNFSDTNIRVRGCYAPEVRSNDVSSANRAYAGTDGTGYGISVNQSPYAVIEENYGSECRRLVDFGGAQSISWYGVCLDNKAVGGGTTYAGEAFWPIGSVVNGCVGSHGSAYGTLYRGNIAIDTNNALNLRGRAERMESGYGYGYMYEPILLHGFGGGHVLGGFHYDDRFSEVGVGAANRYAIPDSPDKRPYCLVLIRADSYTSSIPTRINDMTANKVHGSAIYLNAGTQSDAVGNLEVGNVRVFVSNEGYPGETFRFIRTSTARNFPGFRDIGGNAYSFDGTEYTSFNQYNVDGDLKLGSGNFFISAPPRTIVAEIADDSFVKIPLGTSAAMMMITIFDKNRDRSYFGENMILAVDRAVDYSPSNSTNKTNVNISNAVPTGTTGTDGRMTISYRPGSDGYLYLENRMGNVMFPVIQITMIP